jgi:hypothetical protein
MDLTEYALELLVRDRLAEMRERREHWSRIEWMRRPPRSVRVRLGHALIRLGEGLLPAGPAIDTPQGATHDAVRG